MKLVGMLDSPYVRRVAISLELYGVDFEVQQVSVISTFAEFAAINPVVKAPTLVLDDSTVLMDSTLILDYFEHLAPAERKLLPQQAQARVADLQVIGLALAACEKTVSIVYEQRMRPAEKRHQPWVDRVTKQLLTAYSTLEKLLADRNDEALTQATLTAAVAWSFTQYIMADGVKAENFPALQRHAQWAEQHPAFLKYPID